MNSDDDIDDEENDDSCIDHLSDRLMTFLHVVCLDIGEAILRFDIIASLLPRFGRF